jgi:hypothetical protein
MKFISIFLICLIALLSVTAAHRVRRHHSHPKRSHHIGYSLAGNPDGLENCLPASWKAAAPAEEQKADGDIADNGGILSKMLTVLKVGISLACKVKDSIIKFLVGKLGRNKNRRRFFMMMRTHKGKRRMKRWLISSITSAYNAVASAASSAYNGVKDGLTYVAGKVVEAGAYVVKGLLAGAAAIFNGVVSLIREIKAKIQAFFASDLYKNIVWFINCVKLLKAAAIAVKDNIIGFIDAIKTLMTGWAGVIEVLVNAICNWESFKSAIDYMIAGIKNQGPARWNQFGRFLGQLIVAIGGN